MDEGTKTAVVGTESYRTEVLGNADKAVKTNVGIYPKTVATNVIKKDGTALESDTAETPKTEEDEEGGE